MNFTLNYAVLINNDLMELAFISIIAFLTALITFFSGSGPGTILMPVNAIK